MLKNDENKIVSKLILAIFLALLGSLISTLYISSTQAAVTTHMTEKAD
jgi:hypothetical protein